MGLDSVLPPVVVELRAKFGELFTSLGEVKTELKETAEKTEAAGGRMSTSLKGVAAVGQKLTIGVAGIATTVGGFAVEAATSAEVVDAKLRTAIKNAGGDFEALEPKIQATDKTMRGYGFTNDQTNTSLATLTTALKDPNKAMQAMTVAADLARSKNIDLNTASLLVAKAMEGQTRPLKALGIDLQTYTGGAQNTKLAQDALTKAQDNLNAILAKTPDAADKASKAHGAYEKALAAVKTAQDKLSETQDAGSKILDALKGRVSGAADAYGKTLKGQMDSAKAGVENMGESLGKTLIPWINKAIQVGVKMVDFLTGSGKPILLAIAGIIGLTMVAGIIKWVAEFTKGVVTTASKMVEWIANHTMWSKSASKNFAEQAAAAEENAATNVAAQEEIQGAEEATTAVSEEAGAATAAAYGPIGLAIVAVIGIVMLLKDHWTQVWDAIKTAAQWTWDNVLKPIFGFIIDVALKPVELEIQLLEKAWSIAWNAISSAASWVYNNVIRPVGDGIHTALSAIGDAINWFGQLWNEVWQAVGDGLTWVYNHTIGPIVNIIKDAIGGVMNVIHGIGSAISSVGHFLGFADGGVVPGAPGAPRLAVVHGGEYVLSREMLAGRQQPTGLDKLLPTTPGDPSAAALSATAPPSGASSAGNGVVVIATSNASPSQIARSVGWELRKRAS